MKNVETITVFNYNNYVVKVNIDGITQEESLVSPALGGNCINWVLGHIIVTRDELLAELGCEKLCNEKITNTYISGSPPLNEGDAENITILTKLFEKSQNIITEHIGNLSPDNDIEKIKTCAGFAFHEAYHTGQLGILRRMLGKKSNIK